MIEFKSNYLNNSFDISDKQKNLHKLSASYAQMDLSRRKGSNSNNILDELQSQPKTQKKNFKKKDRKIRKLEREIIDLR